MIRTILLWLGIIIVVILVLLWFITGGVGKTVVAAQDISNTIGSLFWSATSTGQFRLPWQPDLTIGTKITEIPDSPDAEEELAIAQKEYTELQKKIEEAKTFGEPSPYKSSVRIAAGNATSEVNAEYIEMEAASDNSAPVDIAGWSLQSALTGVRAYIPRGTHLFILGEVNEQANIYLNPSATAILSTSLSPIGTSFRENRCTGYLNELQTFVPALSGSCPPPSASIPLTPENLRSYGDACFDFVATLPPCVFPRKVPSNTSAACRAFLANTFSYNGCVETYRHTSDFYRNSWRIYFNAGGELWRNSHDIIRLLDADGRTVDVISY